MEWPWQYSFPPFFTLQPNDDTRRKQLDAWADLTLAYCKSNRIYQLDLVEHESSELFNNKKIERNCSIELLRAIVDYMCKTGRAEWIEGVSSPTSKRSSSSKTPPTASSTKCFVLWHTLDEWSAIIYGYVSRSAMQNTVCTFYELTDSDECAKEEFAHMDKKLFSLILINLQKQRKAELIQLGDESEMGVKFF
jgi:ESCRT-II complex subunit VPS25